MEQIVEEEAGDDEGEAPAARTKGKENAKQDPKSANRIEAKAKAKAKEAPAEEAPAEEEFDTGDGDKEDEFEMDDDVFNPDDRQVMQSSDAINSAWDYLSLLKGR